MTEAYMLLKEHVIHTLTTTQTVTLKEFAAKLVDEHEMIQDDVMKAYHLINNELVGNVD